MQRSTGSSYGKRIRVLSCASVSLRCCLPCLRQGLTITQTGLELVILLPPKELGLWAAPPGPGIFLSYQQLHFPQPKDAMRGSPTKMHLSVVNYAWVSGFALGILISPYIRSFGTVWLAKDEVKNSDNLKNALSGTAHLLHSQPSALNQRKLWPLPDGHGELNNTSRMKISNLKASPLKSDLL